MKIPMLKSHKVNHFFLFSVTVAKRCNYKKHFMATANDTVCKHYFARAEAAEQSVVDQVIDQWPSKGRVFAPMQSLNSCLIEILLFVDDRSHFSVSLKFSHVEAYIAFRV